MLGDLAPVMSRALLNYHGGGLCSLLLLFNQEALVAPLPAANQQGGKSTTMFKTAVFASLLVRNEPQVESLHQSAMAGHMGNLQD